MLAAGDDEDVAAVACYDIGEFVRHYPNGRAIAKRLGAKDIVMQLIESDNEELKRHALQCVSKIMVQNWAVRCILRLNVKTYACFLRMSLSHTMRVSHLLSIIVNTMKRYFSKGYYYFEPCNAISA